MWLLVASVWSYVALLKTKFIFSSPDILKYLSLDTNMSRSNLSMKDTETFGEKVRKLREKADMPLRKLSALLDIDQSTLSKIERGERKPNTELIDKLSSIFSVDKKELQISYVSDKVAYEILSEEYGSEILKVAEEKVKYFKSKTK